MRVVEDPFSGELLQAANDDDLVRVVVKHMAEHHADAGFDDTRSRELVEREAYDATDS